MKNTLLLYIYIQLHFRHHPLAIKSEHQQIARHSRSQQPWPRIVVRPARLRVCAQHHPGRLQASPPSHLSSAITRQTGRPFDQRNGQVFEFGHHDQSGCVDILEHSTQVVRQESVEHHEGISVYDHCAQQTAQVERGVLLSKMVVFISK